MQVDLWSDVVCPWCYVGKRRLERALAGFPHAGDVQVVHRSFQLDAAAPKGRTRSRREMLMAKYRLSEDQVRAMDDRMARVAAADDLDYSVGDGVVGNTADAHRLLHHARGRGLEPALLDRFYRAYFAERRSLFDAESLAALAAEAGLDESEARQVLERDDYAAEVRADQTRAYELGVSGVPFFVIGDRYALSGAQPVDVVGEALERAWAEAAQPSTRA